MAESNDNFFYNSMLARALLQLTPAKDRGVIRLWLNRLQEMYGNAEVMTIRNDYMWFLLLMLQSKRVTVPFNNIPPQDLQPLRQVLPPNVYEEVLTSNDQNMSWLDQVGGEEGETSATARKPEVQSSHPAKFLENQPIPKDGIICYLAAFSDHDY